MKRKQHQFFSWQLKLILALGCLGGLALGLFSQHVASISDAPLGATPLSWRFKPITTRVAAAFEVGDVIHDKNQLTDPLLPVLDQALPEETELALFALG
jgi:hypothetical protein